MSSNLKGKALRALSWSLVELVGLRGVQFVVGVVLARLLLPAQFGLIGMLAIFFSITQLFLDSGLTSALVQKRDVSQTDICTIFYFNVAVGCVGVILLCLVAPLIAAFFREPLLTPMTRVLSVTILINSLGLIQTTLLLKKLDFKTQAKVGIVAALSSGVIGVIMACRGFGVWSLVMQQVSSSVVRTGLLWLLNSWRPALEFSGHALRGMFAFGSRLLASNLLDASFQNIYQVVIGKIFSATDLGYYTRATTMQNLPSQTLNAMVGRVSYPTFCEIKDDPVRLKRAFRTVLTTLALLNFPMMIGLAVTAKPLVLVLLTEKWAPCIPYLQLLCVVGLLYPLHAVQLNMLKVKNRTDLFLRLEIIKKCLIALTILITYRWGITAMILGQIVLSWTAYYINGYYTRRLCGYPFSEQARDLLPLLGMAGATGLVVSSLPYLGVPVGVVLLISQIVLGVAVYAVLCAIMRPPAALEVWNSMRQRLRALQLTGACEPVP